MPHHSAQQQQMNAYGGVPSSLVTGTNVNVPTAPPQEGFPPRSIDQFRSGMIPPPHIQMQQQQQQQAMLRMGGPPADTQWMQQGGPMIHRVPVLSTDDASVASKPFAVATPTSSSPAKDSSSFDSQEVAHSVLLLAAGVPKKRESKDDDDESVERVPLKKRKINSILRHKTTESAPCNVSPMSNGSKALSAESAARTSSYDLKDGQALPDSAKISNTNDICSPPAHVIIPHFPSVLHSLLTDSEFSGSVIQWLPHGQAWRIVRWDALRRQVLPKFFPQLSEEDGKRSSGSIDAFLWHLSAWGFEEIPHGPDAGAYTNVLFRRDLAHLCRDMRFTPNRRDKDNDPKATPASARHRSILQVPSLGSATGSEGHNRMMMEDMRGHFVEQRVMVGQQNMRPTMSGWMPEGRLPQHYPPPPDAHFWMAHAAQQQHQHEQHQHHQQHQQHQQQHQHHQQHQQHQHHANMQGPPQQEPRQQYANMARVQSGRGAARLPAMRRPNAAVSAAAAPNNRPNFSVSNRGKGRSKATRRAPTPKATDTVDSAIKYKSAIVATVTETTGTPIVITKPAETTGKPAPVSILKRKLPMVTSRTDKDEATVVRAAPVSILKRKLPMTTNTTSSSTIDTPVVTAEEVDTVRPAPVSILKRKLPLTIRKTCSEEDDKPIVAV